MTKGLVSGEKVVSDGSFIPANVSEDSVIEITAEVEKSTVRYLDVLDEEFRQQTGYKEPITVKEEKIIVKSETDAQNAGTAIRKTKRGLVT